MHRAVLLATGLVIGLLGLVLGAAGLWLIVLGGSWFYVVVAVGFILTGFFLIRGRAAALWVSAAVVLGTRGWALWEVGLDWWPLAARGDVIFVLSPRPARVLHRVEVPFFEEREPKLKTETRFREIEQQVLKMMLESGIRT